jgi:hypothetical protein
MVRCWVLRDDSQPERAVFSIEHIQSGERKRFNTLGEVGDWMKESLSSPSHAGEDDADDEQLAGPP